MNIREIAAIAGVSPTTVSKVINGKCDDISPATQEKILEIVKKNRYVPFGDVLARKSTYLIGVIAEREVSRALLTGITRNAQKAGYASIVCYVESAEEEAASAELLLSHNVEGILWIRSRFSGSDIPSFVSRRNVPVFCVNEHDSNRQGVSLSYEELGLYAGRKLIASGHKRITCVSGAMMTTSSSLLAEYGVRFLKMTYLLNCKMFGSLFRIVIQLGCTPTRVSSAWTLQRYHVSQIWPNAIIFESLNISPLFPCAMRNGNSMESISRACIGPGTLCCGTYCGSDREYGK